MISIIFARERSSRAAITSTARKRLFPPGNGAPVFDLIPLDAQVDGVLVPAEIDAARGYAEAEKARRPPATITRRLAAVRYAHRLAGIAEPPTGAELVKATMRGLGAPSARHPASRARRRLTWSPAC
jgi:hypothetical protein